MQSWTVAGLLDRVGDAVRSGESITVAYANVHVLDTAVRDRGLLEFLGAADVVYADGNGVIAAARWRGTDLGERMTGADWIEDFAARAVRSGWRVGWVGGTYGAVADAERALRTRHPGFALAFGSHGYPRGDAGDRALIEQIRAARLDVLLVGMGTPVQERWVADRRAALGVPVVWCVGAVADFASGRTSRGPRWLHHRHEWLARLLVEPRRLWKRYLVGNPRFVWRVLRGR